MAEVKLEKVSKRYGRVTVVHGIDLAIAHNEFIVLVGPSGCGKSTTLRMIAGLEDISEGVIRIGDRVVNTLPPRSRNISMVFQNYALYPHMTVRENLGFGLKIAKESPAAITRRVDEAAEILGLHSMMDRLPAHLSGGQRQRVAMGRAIVRQPAVFLFDEPLSNLDAKLRVQMRAEIKRLHQKVQTTVVYVTHDQVEAMTLADRIVLMREGVIEQIGTPLDLFERPVNIFVASFIGSPPMNLIDARVEARGGAPCAVLADGTALALRGDLASRVHANQAVVVGFRPDDLAPVDHGIQGAGETMTFEKRVTLAEPLGTETILYTDLGGSEVVGKMLIPRAVADGETMPFRLQLARLHVFDKASGQHVLTPQEK
jgi:multiple sugar transport system ATP-binding protein